MPAFARQQSASGNDPWLRVGSFDHEAFAAQFHRPIPVDSFQDVYREGKTVLVKPRGFFLWQTKETVGTPDDDPRLICFVDGKSSRARVGLVVHMTAPTLHAGWWGQVTLEIANLGPFTLALREGDAVAQIVVAALTSPPVKRKNTKGIKVGQHNVAGQGGASPGAAATPPAGP